MRITPARVRNKLLRSGKSVRFHVRAVVRSRRFANEAEYDLAAVNLAFADRKRAAEPGDERVLLRICDAYIKSKQAQAGGAPAFRPSNEWLPIYERPLREVMQMLENRDVEGLAATYGNFWRDPCSAGLLGLPVNMERAFFRGKIGRTSRMMFLNDAFHRLNLWKERTGNRYPIDVLSSPTIGNPYGLSMHRQFIKAGSDYLHFYAQLIGELTASVERPFVAELGGGYGGMAYYLLRDLPTACYVDFDLPENMALTAYYLLTAFPDRRALLFGEADLGAVDIADYDIVILPSLAMTEMPTAKFSCSFNSYSLAEMSLDAIDTYVSHLERMLAPKGHFLHVNHTRNSVVVGDDFGLESRGLELVRRTPALWNAAVNPWMDEAEFLYVKPSALA